ncbi:hypothetical protein D3C87_1353640 [compost metagenome]
MTSHDHRLPVRGPVRPDVHRCSHRHFPGAGRLADHHFFQPRFRALPGDQTVRDVGALHTAGDPVFPARRRLHDHRWRCAPADRLCQCLCRPYSRRPGHRRCIGVHVVRRAFRFKPRDGGCGGLDCHCRHGPLRLSASLWRRDHLQRRDSGHPDSAFDRDGGLRRRHRNLRRQAVHGRCGARPVAGHRTDGGDLHRRR